MIDFLILSAFTLLIINTCGPVLYAFFITIINKFFRNARPKLNPNLFFDIKFNFVLDLFKCTKIWIVFDFCYWLMIGNIIIIPFFVESEILFVFSCLYSTFVFLISSIFYYTIYKRISKFFEHKNEIRKNK